MRFTLVSLLLLCTIAPLASARNGGEEKFIESARVNRDHTVTLPLYEGRSGGRRVWYMVTESSTGDAADRLRVNRSQKLKNAHGTRAVQRGFFDRNGLLNFTATVDFAPVRVVVPDPLLGFPPLEAAPGAIAEVGYSPLVQLPDGTILNAPHVANDSGKADKALDLDFARGEVDFELTDGFARDKTVIYISTDASDPLAAALENVTFAPLLNAAPSVGGDGTDSARASLAAVVNGQTGVRNRERQGLNSALLGEGDPLNMLAWLPNQGRYSPLWDVHLSAWSAGARVRRIEDFSDIEDLAEDGDITAPDGSAWGPTGFIVNCPIVARLRD